ncbi:MAG: PulJ/GspJ family protein [Methylobacter sp.]
MMSLRFRAQSGFTLIEAIMVMVITGILAVLATSFAAPLQGYFDATARADLSDAADTALRRMARELRTALPNSVRVSGSYIEFLPTITGGRYRRVQDCSGACAGDILSFSVADNSFDVIGPLTVAPTANQEVVVYNMGGAGANAYCGITSNVLVCDGNGDGVMTGSDLNVARVDGASTINHIVITANKLFPFESPAQRFQIIDLPLTFACVGTTLWRYSGYGKQTFQPTDISAAPLSGATSQARIATGVNCAASTFSYNPGNTQRGGLVTMSLTLSNNINQPVNPDSVTLLHQVHVQNVP